MDRLPTEIILVILEDLGFWERKQLQRVCKRFRSIFLTKTGATLLFRDRLAVSTSAQYHWTRDVGLRAEYRHIGNPLRNTTYHINPIFNDIHHWFDGDRGELERINIRYPLHQLEITERAPEGDWRRHWRWTQFSGSQLNSLNAVSPAVATLCIHVFDWKPIIVHGGCVDVDDEAFHTRSVTIMDVMEAVLCATQAKHFIVRDGEEKVFWGMEDLEDSLDDVIESPNVGKVEWNGVDKLEVIDGMVHLYISFAQKHCGIIFE